MNNLNKELIKIASEWIENNHKDACEIYREYKNARKHARNRKEAVRVSRHYKGLTQNMAAWSLNAIEYAYLTLKFNSVLNGLDDLANVDKEQHQDELLKAI